MNSGRLALSWPWRSRLAALLDPWCRSGLSFWRSSQLARRASRSTSLYLSWWGLLLRVGLLGLGVTYGAMWMWASFVFASGMPVITETGVSVRFVDMRRAAALFPLSRHLRSEVPRATAAFLQFIPLEVLRDDVDTALKNDPWAWDLVHNSKEIRRWIEMRDKRDAAGHR